MNPCRSEPWVSIAQNLLDYQFLSRRSYLRRNTIQLLTEMSLPKPVIDEAREIVFVPRIAANNSSSFSNTLLEAIGLENVLQEMKKLNQHKKNPDWKLDDPTIEPFLCSTCLTDFSPFWTCNFEGNTVCESCHNNEMRLAVIHPYLAEISQVLKDALEQELTLCTERKAIASNLKLLHRFYTSYSGLASNTDHMKSVQSHSAKEKENSTSKSDNTPDENPNNGNIAMKTT